MVRPGQLQPTTAERFTLAIYHCSVKTISRRTGRSATGAAAYRAGQTITDERSGLTHDYSRRSGVVETAILLPAGSPAELSERSTLWNAAEKAERRKDATVARELVLALPHEIDAAGKIELALGMGQFLVSRYGVGVDVAIHEASGKDGHDFRNDHAHLLFTTREISEQGLGAKTRILDTRPSGPAEIEAIRLEWEQRLNAKLEQAGYEQRVDRRTLAAQGIERVPQVHRGPKAQAIHDRRKRVESFVREDFKGRVVNYPEIDQGRSRPEFNAEIIALNDHRAEHGTVPLEVQIKNIERLIEVLMEKVTDLEAIIPRTLLPEWARRRLEKGWRKSIEIMEQVFLEREIAEKRRKKREGVHAQMERMRSQIKALEQERDRYRGLQSLYFRIESHAAMKPPIWQTERPPPRLITNHQFGVELRFKAQAARSVVPPEYRPQIERADGASNDGIAVRPVPISPSFNRAANPHPKRPYKQKISIGFGHP